MARIAWLLVVALFLAAFIASIPAYATQLQIVCADPSGQECNYAQLTGAEVQTLAQLGIALDRYAAYTVTLHGVTSLVYLVTGMVIFRRRSGDWYGYMVSLFLIIFGAGGPSAVFANAFTWRYPQLAAVLSAPGSLMFPGLGLFLTTFPDGRFTPRWSRLVPVLWIAQLVLWPTISTLPPPLFAAELLLVYGSTLAVQVYRYRKIADAVQRQQTKWVLFGFALAVSTIVIQGVLSATIPSFSAFAGIVEGTWIGLVFMPIPVTIGIAILRYRLWDVDIIVNRALVYGLLTALVLGTYVFVVAYLGALFRADGTRLPALIATGLVAVLFQPLREQVQRGVNRLMFGDRDDPYAVISRLGLRLEATLAPDAALPTIVHTIKEALKLPYVAIALKQDAGFMVVAAAGEPQAAPVVWQLVYQHEPVGQLLLAPRTPDDPFGRADRQLLDDLARQVGVVTHAVQLTRELQRANADLRDSRERLILLREEERRRIRRDLHDGLGPTLASLTFKLDAARNLLRRDPERADALLTTATQTTQTAITDIRRLVYALHPPVLDQLGLRAAICELANQYEGRTLAITVDAPGTLPSLPAAVEVAAYWIVQEALLNVVKHALAQTCTIRVALSERALRIDVADDGRGVPAQDRPAGVGLFAMRERAEELGGVWTIERGVGGGTVVQVELPLGEGQ